MRKEFKRFGSSLISVLLIAVMLFNMVACRGKENSSDEISSNSSVDIDSSLDDVAEPSEIESVTVKLAQKQPLVGEETSTRGRVITSSKLKAYKATVKVDDKEGIESYATESVDVAFETNADEYGITDTIAVGDTIVLEKGYRSVSESMEEDVSLSDIYADYYEIEIDYTDDGQVQGLYYYDRYYIYHYNEDGSLADVYRNGDLYKKFDYNSNGDVREEVYEDGESSFEKAYSYTEQGALYSINAEKVTDVIKDGNAFTIENKQFLYNQSLLTSVSGAYSASFEYDYVFEGESFLTKKKVGDVTTEYKYVGDKVTEISQEDQILSYILDKDLNYVGIKFDQEKYYFAVDPFGMVMGLINVEGDFVVEYAYDAFGKVERVFGALADTLGKLNEVINLNGIYDADLGCYFFAGDVYLPQSGITIRAETNKAVNVKSINKWEQSNFFARSAVSTFAQIHDKVVDVVAENLQNDGFDVKTHLYAMDENDDLRRFVDLYTLPYEVTPFSAKNLLNGNQVYEVLFHNPESESFDVAAKDKLNKILEDWSVGYFAEYTPVLGTMKFAGQFVYMGYLIDYDCSGGGLVEYQVKKNTRSNYDQTVNIYDYDNNKYVCYVNNTFDLNFLDGVTIIPGKTYSIPRETYESLDTYLSGYMQSVAGDICDQMMIYDDPNYYNLEEMNVAHDYWEQMNLEDTTHYLEIKEDGTIAAEKMPVWETDGFRTKLIVGAAVIAVTAIVATVTLCIPGANCVVVSICVGAAKGAISGALSGIAMGFVEPLINISLEAIATGHWDFSNYFDDALSAAATGFATGAITGAVMGGIKGGVQPKYCFEAGTPIATANGFAAIESIGIGDNVWAYDYKTGEKALKPVTATSVRQTDRIINLTVGNETLITTPEHPFYVVNHEKYHGYTAAKYLSVGDCIQTLDGKYQKIKALDIETLNEEISVYNIRVKDYQSYYVGEENLLVHNDSCSQVSKYYADIENRQFDSYRAFKKHYGKAGDGYEWHHIVEQNQVKKGVVAARNVYSVENTIKLDYANHRKISAYYSSTTQPFTHGLSVRNWLSRFSYEEQYSYGLQFLERVCGVIVT